ncbi:MAG: rod shape-determining protein MreD [Candidatus Aquicultor sp.]
MWPVLQSCLVVLGAFILQAVLVPHIALGGTKPDIILIVTALYGFTYGAQVGAIAGFFGGFLGDLAGGMHVGLGLVSKSIVGFFAGLVQRTIFVESILLPMLAIFIATWLNEFVYVGFMFLLGEITPIKVLMLQVILPTAIYNALLTPLIYLIVRRFLVFKQETPSINVARKYE